ARGFALPHEQHHDPLRCAHVERRELRVDLVDDRLARTPDQRADGFARLEGLLVVDGLNCGFHSRDNNCLGNICQGDKQTYSGTAGYFSGKGTNSVSPGMGGKRWSRQSCLASSVRSRVRATKFHQMKRSPSVFAPPSSITRAAVAARTSTRSPVASTARC